jgi:protein tyrosine kinase modulator
VVPQRVPENYVKSTVTARIEDRLQSIRQQILSRTRLERIIEEFNLYEKERATELMEDIVARMRNDVAIDVVRGDAFRVAYVGGEPRTVMRVTDRLADLFKEENLRDREVMAEGTNQFLETQLADARRRLIEHEKKLEDYRLRHAGELPSQLDSNLQAMQNAQLQIQSLLEALNRDRDRRLIAERQLTELRAEAGRQVAVSPSPDGTGEVVGSTQQQLASARATLQALQSRLTPNHPDIGLWKRRVRDLEKKAEAEALDAPLSDSPSAKPTSPEDALRHRRIADLTAEVEQLDRQIASKQREEQRLRETVQGYQRRVEAAPARESEMVELTRDYTTIQTLYSSLLAKNEEAKISANLERRQIGEQFKILDPARFPEKPFSPNRPQLKAFGIAGGLALGILLVALFEYRDRSFHVDDEITTVLSLPVLAVVPVMFSLDEKRQRRRRNLVLNVALGSTVAGCLAVVAYTFVH